MIMIPGYLEGHGQYAARAKPENEKYDYPKNLFVFKNPKLLINEEEVQKYLGGRLAEFSMANPVYGDKFLAYAIQLQRYTPSFKGPTYNDNGGKEQKKYALIEGDIFGMVYRNWLLVDKEEKDTAKELANKINLIVLDHAIRIEDIGENGDFVDDKSGTIDCVIRVLFNRVMTEFKNEQRYWPSNYPHVSIATVNIPELTDKIMAAGLDAGASVHIG